MKKLSVVLATRNEEDNIARCLQAVQGIADEIIIFDEHSTDKTVEIAKGFGAVVIDTNHESNFHITKQKAISKAVGEWILQLDADEVVTPKLSSEIKEILKMDNAEILKRVQENTNDDRLFKRHLELLENRDGKTTKQGEVVAFLIPRINMFLGKPLIHGGVYPDGVIRLIKRGKAYLPAQSVHEQMVIDGQVSWLFNPLEHWDSPTLFRYIARLNRYTDLQAGELKKNKTQKTFTNLIRFTTFHPLRVFLDRFILHGGYKDGMFGFVWAVFSAWHYPIAYFKFVTK